MSVGAAGGGAGAGVVEDGDQGVGGGADHGLQVEAGVRERGDGQGTLPGPLGDPRTGETRAWGVRGERVDMRAGRRNWPFATTTVNSECAVNLLNLMNLSLFLSF